MPIPNASYPFDPTGVASTNLVDGERQIIPAPNAANFVLIIPFAAPYFRSSLRVIHVPTGRQLAEGVDYYCTHYFYEATTKIGQPIYGSITMIDRSLSGTVDLRYQTIGGDWTLDSAALQEILSQTLLDPRRAVWEQITELPYAFPPLGHEHDVVDMTGMTDVVDAIYAIAQSITDMATGANQSHIDDKNNPHETTKAQVGLGLVQNYGLASSPEASAGLVSNKYMTPVLTRTAISDQVGSAFTAHAGNSNNPHGTTKLQVGLGSVENFPPASMPEALAGTANDRVMTPFTVAALIEDRTGGSVGAHEARRDNPHQVTKAQVGLPLTPNYAPASPQQAIDGVSNDTLMTPNLTRTFFESNIGSQLSDHLADTNNPHGTTKDQVGLGQVPNLPLATLEAAQLGMSDSGFITPRLAWVAIAAYLDSVGLGTGSYDISTHLADHDNPHQVTAAQIDAYTTNEVDGLVGNKLDINGTAVNSGLLGGLTAAQVVSLARNRIEFAAVDSGDHAGPTWTRVANFIPAVSPDPANPPRDLVFYLTGGEAIGNIDTPMYLVRMDVSGVAQMHVQQIAGEVGNATFGYVRGGGGEIAVYIASPALRKSFSVLVVSDPNESIGNSPSIVDVEPVGWQPSNDVARDAGINYDATPGEVSFGYNPNNPSPSEPDQIVHTVNVAGDAGEVATAQADVATFEDLFDWITQSAYGSQNYDATPANHLNWNAQTSVIGINTGVLYDGAAAPTSLVTLRDKDQYQDYTFEVEISSTSADRQAIGVCAASVRLFGRDYGIYVLRTPGQTTTDSGADILPGGDIYRNLTIALNPFQIDALDLGSTNVDVADSASGWGIVGVCRIRVEKIGTSITIKTSQLGSTTIDEDLTVVIDLNSDPRLERFKGPTSYGVACFKQDSCLFEFVSRPGHLRPYIDNYSAYAYRDHNGVSWNSSVPLKLDQPQIKPGRILHSPINGKLFAVRRNGRLKELVIS